MNPVPDLLPETNSSPPGAPNAPAVALDDPHVIQAVEEYLAALEDGPKPDHRAFLACHPEIAEALAKCLDGLEFVHVVAPQLSSPSRGQPAAAAPEFQPEGPLGDFRILREEGRGGMGVVYEAVQISLGRRVALKVLPFAAALDAKQLQRFKNEAQAAAHLQHTHIVPVYYVGCERGVHFYAMQFIDGQTLAALIRQLRQLAGWEGAGGRDSGRWTPARRAKAGPPPCTEPRSASDPRPPPPEEPPTPFVAAPSTEHSATSPAFFRTVAHLGLQAAEALEHAHQLGVIHRDIKPANLLVEGRAGGVNPLFLWVTDFGLAHCQSQPGLTLSGDLVGTLRYMSPEQALAQRGAVDARTDIYSLGVTLYELLTLEPAYDGRNREELLRQIAFEEPRPPRRLNRAVPAELETIVLKAMAKAPEERYAAAQELADDLRRFLEDRPIQARRPTLLQRLRKWSRRHRAVMFAAAAIMCITLLAAMVSTALVWREKLRADEARDRARDAATALEAALEAEAGQRRRAEGQEQLARQAVDDMYTQVAEKWLADQPNLQPVQREFLLKALRFYKEFAQDSRTEPAVRRKAGEAYRRVAAIQHNLGQYEKAHEALVQSVTVFEQLVAGFPAVPEYREDLARTCYLRGQLLNVTSRFQEAEETYARALALWEKLAADAPALPRHRHNQAQCRSHLGLLLRATGRMDEAEQAFRQALAAFEKLAEEFQDEPMYARNLAASRRYLGDVLHLGKRLEEAEEAFRHARLPLQKLVERFPAKPLYLYDLGNAHGSLGSLLLENGRIPEAEQAYTEARTCYEKLVANFPSMPAYRQALASAHDKLGFLRLESARFVEAGEDFHRALPLVEKLVGDFPRIAEYQSRLAELLRHLATLAYKQGDFDEACRLVERALIHDKLALDANPRHGAYRQSLRTAYRLRAHILVRQGKHAAAAQAATDLNRCSLSPAEDGGDAAELLNLCASLAEKDAALPPIKRKELAQTYREQAHKLLGQADTPERRQ